MKKFKIRELELFSGIKAHTIRVWEQRYAIFTPQRSSGNMRFYSIEDVQYLLHVALLLKENYKISHLVKLNLEELTSKVEAIDTEEGLIERTINDLIVLMHLSEIEEFEDVLDSCVLTAGIDTTVREVIFPFLERIQLLSYNDSSINTHFAVTVVRKKIISAIESARPLEITDKKALLFLPENEHFDLLLLYVTYLLKVSGISILYLGTNVSIKNLETAVIEKKPDLLVTHFPCKQLLNTEAFLHYLYSALPDAKLYALTSIAIAGSASNPNFAVINYHDIQKTFLGFKTH